MNANRESSRLQTRAKVLDRAFYRRKSTIVARDLIGMTLVRNLEDGNYLSGTIIETEAYGGLKDPASHAYRGKTKRNEAMFGEAGFSYVYFTYGFHHCLNLVCGRVGDAQAVLLRAIEPVRGIEVMRERRGVTSDLELASGPGKLCQAMGIDLSLNTVDATKRSSPICVRDELTSEKKRRRVASGVRIGINVAQEREWRFFDPYSLYVSHRRRKLNLPMKS